MQHGEKYPNHPVSHQQKQVLLMFFLLPSALALLPSCTSSSLLAYYS